MRNIATNFVLFLLSYCSLGAVQITNIYPSMQFGYGPVHVLVLANGDFAEVCSGVITDFVDTNAVGAAESSPDNWQIGDDVEQVTVKHRVYKRVFEHFGNWSEVDTTVLVNRYANNAYLQLMRYTEDPARSSPSATLAEFATSPNWIKTKKHGLMIGHQKLDLSHFAPGDKLHFRELTGTAGSSFMVYNASTKQFLYPFWKVADTPLSPAAYRVLSRVDKDEFTYYTLDNELKLKVPKRKRFGLLPIPLFSVGDYAIIKLKKTWGGRDYGLLLVHSTTGEEVLARSYDSVPGFWGKSCDSSSKIVSLYNYPHRIELASSANICTVDTFHSVLIAVNPKGDGFILLNGMDVWHNGLRYQPFDADSYPSIPVHAIHWNANNGQDPYQDIFPFQPR